MGNARDAEDSLPDSTTAQWFHKTSPHWGVGQGMTQLFAFGLSGSLDMENGEG